MARSRKKLTPDINGMSAKQMKRKKPINNDMLVNIEPLTPAQEKVFEFWNNITITWDEALTPIGATWATAQEEWSLATNKWEDPREAVEQTIYKDRIFCTDQTISQRASEYYDPIKGLYKKSTSRDNTYKVYNG